MTKQVSSGFSWRVDARSTSHFAARPVRPGCCVPRNQPVHRSQNEIMSGNIDFFTRSCYLIPEGASEITRAVRKGVAIEGSSPLAKQIETIARDIAEGVSVIKKASAGRRFVEYFSVSHAAIEGKG